MPNVVTSEAARWKGHGTSKLAPQMSLTQLPRPRAATCGGWSPLRRTRRPWDMAEAAARTATWEARRGGGGTGTTMADGWLAPRGSRGHITLFRAALENICWAKKQFSPWLEDLKSLDYEMDG